MCDGVDNHSPALVYHGTPAPACVPHYKPGRQHGNYLAPDGGKEKDVSPWGIHPSDAYWMVNQVVAGTSMRTRLSSTEPEI